LTEVTLPAGGSWEEKNAKEKGKLFRERKPTADGNNMGRESIRDDSGNSTPKSKQVPIRYNADSGAARKNNPRKNYYKKNRKTS